MVSNDLQYIKGLPLQCGIDFGAGTLNPAAIIGQLDPVHGRWNILKEVVCNGMGLLEFADQLIITIKENFPLQHKLQIWGDPAGLQRDGISMKTYFDHLATKGLYANPAPSNTVDVRIECIRTPMLRFSQGKPGFLVSKDCNVLIQALAGKWYYKHLNVSGEDRYDEKPCKDHPYSDVADALGYLLSGGGEYQILTTYRQNIIAETFTVDTSWDVI